MIGNELYVELQTELDGLKAAGEAPGWLTIEGLGTLNSGYLLEGETPKGMWRRVSDTAAGYYRGVNLGTWTEQELSNRFFELFWRGWLGGSSPVLANMGTDRGFPISCFASYVGDNRDSIFSSFEETAWISSMGGGTAFHGSDIRPRGAKIKTGGVSNGIIPWCKSYDSILVAVKQASFRKGQGAFYYSIEGEDYYDFLKMRQPHGDPNLVCSNIHHAVVIPDSFMEKLQAGNKEAKKRWADLLQKRKQTGEPYLFFIDTVNNNNPDCYKALGLDVKGSNLCSEIALHTSELYTLVCCLSSLNAAKYDEWKEVGASVVRLSILLLDAVIEEFITKAKGKPGFAKAVRFAEESRAVGLGVMGYHTLLQKRNLPFASPEARELNIELFKLISEESHKASRELALLLGEPKWCKGFGVRNTHTGTVAPTKSNSTICGNVSEGIEPYLANYFVKDTKGAFIQRNPQLIELLEELGENKEEVWASISNKGGSVKHLAFLSDHQKEVFKTAHEIDQLEIVEHAADRQQYIDQSQSLNLFIKENASMKSINEVHYTAWKRGVKSLYYQKGEPKSRASSEVDYSALTLATPEACPLTKPENDEVCIPCQG
jgi:ribonucleoside-diphosphate reductase alpha chain